MKKLIYCAAALVTALIAGSCQRELLDPAGGNGTVTYTVQVPEIGTKALGDDVTVINDLVYAVYRTKKATLKETLENWADATYLVYDKNVEAQAYNNGKTTVSLELINNQNYVILFWAQQKDVWVKGDKFDLTNITYPSELKTDSMNADKYAAFSGVEFLAAGDFAGQHTATLTRPFAQINIAAKDPDNYDVTVTGATVTVKEAGDQFNVATQLAATKKNQVVYTWTTKPESTEFAVNGVAYEHYVAMNYVFAYDNVKVAYDINTENHGTVSNEIINVPVAKNYRTNIVGKLLTSMVDYSIELDNNWGPEGEDDEDKVVSVWDGSSISEPTCIDNTYTINTAEELAWIAAAVNGTLPETRSAESISFSGKTVVLAADINLNGKEWTPIAISGKYFEGTFDGANHTVSNYQINREGHAGLFGNARASIENLTVKDVTIVANHYAGAIVGQGYAKINNCHVENVDIVLSTKNNDWGDKAGGIIGQNCEGGLYVKNSSAKNVTITGYRDLGGIAGMAHNNNIVSGCSVENITITQDLTVNYEDQTPTTVGAVVGRVGANATIDNNQVVGGIVIEKLVNDNDTFAELLKKGGNIVLKTGEYTFPAGNVYAGEVNVSAAEEANVTITLPKSTYISGTSLTLDGITFKVPAGLTYDESAFAFIHHAAEFNMNNCIVEGGRLRLNVNEANIEHCQFNITASSSFDGYGLFYYGNNGSTVNVSNSIFTGLQKAIVLYNESAVTMNLNVDSCTFTASEATDKAAISIHSELGINGTVSINNSTASGFADYNGGLWRDVNNTTGVDNNKFTVSVDGNVVAVAGVQRVNGYPNLYKDQDGAYLIASLDGLKDWYNFLNANKSRNPYACTVKLFTDINANGWTWNSLYIVADSGVTPGYTFDGNGKTISNLTISGEGLVTGGVAGMVYKNLTVNGAKVNGSHNAAIFVGGTYSSVSFENVAVKNSTVNGYCNSGIFVGGTYEPNNLVVTFKNCSVENSSVSATGYQRQDPTGASGFLGRAYASTKVVFEGTNSIDDATTITNENGLVGGKVYGYTTWYGDGFTGTGACDTFTNWDGLDFELVSEGLLKNKNTTVYYVSSAAGLEKMNQMFSEKTAGRDVVLNLTEDIDFTGKTWTPVDSHADSAFEIAEINGNGHTISNLTIDGQAMFTRFAGTGDVVVKDITFDNATVNSNGNINTSILTVQTYQNVLLDNVDVKNSTIIGGYKVAPLIATVYNEKPSTIIATLKNCDVVNTTVKATTYDFCTAGMVAFVHAGNNDQVAFENCTVSDVKLYAPNVYTAHAAIYTTGSETLFNEAEGVTVSNVTFENI